MDQPSPRMEVQSSACVFAEPRSGSDGVKVSPREKRPARSCAIVERTLEVRPARWDLGGDPSRRATPFGALARRGKARRSSLNRDVGRWAEKSQAGRRDPATAGHVRTTGTLGPLPSDSDTELWPRLFWDF